MSTTWRSWHLHIATLAPAALDSVVTEAVGPVADQLGLLEPDGPLWFFIRYWQGGPHVRLRIAGLTEAEAGRAEADLADRLLALDAAVPQTQRLDQDAYVRAVSPLAAAGERGMPLAAGELVAPGIRRVAYEPEHERYGGRHLIAQSERLFHSSSRVALRVCLSRAGTRHGLASCLEATAAACSVLGGSSPSASRTRFLTAQRDMWLDWAQPRDAPVDKAEEIRHQLTERAGEQITALGTLGRWLRETMHTGDPRWAEWTDPLGAALRLWNAELGSARATRIFGSHVHMTANRLGAGAGREAQTAALLLAALESTTLTEPA
ncbi:thiopeptide-type bacteriocin biosynthesis protein [Streptacidiphilus sp. EB129]|uniref:thiopeptide-type bacteriocin biosynthesis protein n=1 Tax=Streptacidiphilus sp. EB129 TaxID=3156262 RepID=UPI003511C67E